MTVRREGPRPFGVVREETGPPPLLEWGVASQALAGNEISGDLPLVRLMGQRALVAAIDGLGHGQDAARAAALAVGTLEDLAGLPPDALLDRCQEALRGSRGAVGSVAVFDGDEDTLTWAGVGDVEGVLLRRSAVVRDEIDYLIRRPGVLGGSNWLRPRLQALPLAPGDTLILATDGVRTGFEAGVVLRDPPELIAQQILAEHASQLDDSLVVVARYLGRRSTAGGGRKRVKVVAAAADPAAEEKR